MKHSLLLATLTLCGTLAFAQAEPSEEMTVDSSSEIVTEKKSVMDLMDEFIAEKGWSGGTNVKGDSFFIVTTGSGVISAPPNSPQYNTSRVLAFAKAMLDAKANMAKELETTIETASSYRYAEHPEPNPDDPAQMAAAAMAEMPDTSIGGKLVALTHGALDRALAKVGSDINARAASAEEKLAAAQAKMKEISTESHFSRSIGAAAAAAVSGMQAFYTVEADGEIGVVTIWSPKLAETAATMLTGKVPNAGKGKKRIIDQIPKDKAVLLSTFGVQQKIDENGNLVLVSYGQASARSKSKQASKAAYSKAALDAQAAIRAFAGESVTSTESLDQAESLTEYNGDAAPDYSSSEAYEQYQKSVAKAMPINGIQTIKRWDAVHPVSGQKVYGVVCTWSAANAKLARQTKKAIEATAKAGAEGKRTIPANEGSLGGKKTSSANDAKPTVASEDFYGSGSSGDDDAF